MADQILVTGASGFIGLRCVMELLNLGYQVRGTIRDVGRGEALNEVLNGHGVDTQHLSFVKADLTSDIGWNEAAQGCKYVIHMASPLPRKPPKHKNDLIIPAKEGCLRVLRAALAAGCERVVMTSSVAAVLYGHKRDGSQTYTEEHWSKLSDDVGAYEQSKTIAEQAAWGFVKENPRLDLVCICPSLVLGPVLEKDYGTSGEVVRKLMAREFPAIPDIGWATVDVRDVVDAHIAALTAEGAVGERFICSTEHTSLMDIALILKDHFDGRYRIPTRKLPDWLLRVIATFDKTARLGLQELGRRQDLRLDKIRQIMDWQPRTHSKMITDMAESMIKLGVI